MNEQHMDPEEEKMLFVQGRLKGIRNIEFREKMSLDSVLREEVELLLKLRQMERDKRSAELAQDIEEWDKRKEKKAEPEIRPLYAQPWFRIAASVLLVAAIGAGIWLMQRDQSSFEFVNIPVHNSEKGAFGFTPTGENDGMYVGKVSVDASVSAQYRVQGDTLELVVPETVKTGPTLYIVNDLEQNRLILVWGSRRFSLESGISGKWLPLHELNQ